MTALQNTLPGKPTNYAKMVRPIIDFQLWRSGPGRNGIVKKLIGALAVGMIVGAAATQVVGMAWAAAECHAGIIVKRYLHQATLSVSRVGPNLFDVPIAVPDAYQIEVICSLLEPMPRGDVMPRSAPSPLPGAGTPLPGSLGPRGAPGQH
jgi:hypothetical protein